MSRMKRLSYLFDKFEGDGQDITWEEELELFSFLIAVNYYPEKFHYYHAQRLIKKGFLDENGKILKK